MKLDEVMIGRILRSKNELEIYLADICIRRAENLTTRRRIYWREAALRLETESDLARAEGDTEIADELAQVRMRFVEAEALAQFTSIANFTSISHLASVAKPLVGTMPHAEQPTEDMSPEHDLISPAQWKNLKNAYREEKKLSTPNHVEAEVAVAVEAAVAVEIEIEVVHTEAASDQGQADALETARLNAVERMAGVRAFEAALWADVTNLCEDEYEGLTRDFLCRSLFCEIRSQIEDVRAVTALFPGIAHSETKLATMSAMLTEVAVARERTEFPFSLEPNDRIALSALWPQFWSVLADAYKRCAVASDIVHWLGTSTNDLTRDERTQLLDSAGCAQQYMFRIREVTSGRDRVQSQLHKMILEIKDRGDIGWLTSLDKCTSDASLIEKCEGIEEVFLKIKRRMEDQQDQIDRHNRRDAAILAVVSWDEDMEGRSVTKDTLENDREALCALLAECLEAKVPPTNVRVRTAILDTAPVLLVGQARYIKFLEAVLSERQRKGLDKVEVDDEPEVEEPGAIAQDYEAMRKVVADYLRGKSVMILGGKTKPATRDQLSLALECDINWPDTEHNDRGGKHDGDMKRSDVILLVKSFARHDLLHRSREIMKVQNGELIKLPAGYGVHQVVHQVYSFVARKNQTNKKDKEKVAA